MRKQIAYDYNIEYILRTFLNTLEFCCNAEGTYSSAKIEKEIEKVLNDKSVKTVNIYNNICSFKGKKDSYYIKSNIICMDIYRLVFKNKVIEILDIPKFSYKFKGIYSYNIVENCDKIEYLELFLEGYNIAITYDNGTVVKINDLRILELLLSEEVYNEGTLRLVKQEA